MTGTTRPIGPAGRSSQILDLLAERGRLGVSEAADLLQVSEATIRRDFTDLTRRRLATRNHGGIVATSVAYELPLRYRSTRADDALDRIAAGVAELIRPGDTVALNGGTTTTAVARALTSRSELVDEDPGLTIVTNALNIANETVLRPRVRCVSLGGVARPESYEVTGGLTTLVLANLWFDVAVVGVTGLTAEQGAMCHLEDEALVVRTMVEHADRVIVAAAGDKIGTRAFASICPAESIHDLVTTAAPDDPRSRDLADAGVRVHSV